MSNKNSPKLPIGTIVGEKYRVERHVGDGGMGQVVAARHLVLNELFAIKLMHYQDLANPQAAARFVREARAVVKLKNNEHVARVHDVGKRRSGDLYIVMELLVGQDLGELLKKRGVLPIHEACAYVLQACNALVEAHDLGIIHRDLKPTNLFLTHRKDGSACIKVLDFGISKVLTTEEQNGEVEITGTREMMGSPLYMSPEQAKSARDVDERTDIWALGAILYKLLTGKAPIPGQTFAEVSFALLESTSVRPPSELRPDIPRQLDACILRCLEKSSHRRYRNVSDLMQALAPFALPQANTHDEEDGVATVLQPVKTRPPHPQRLGDTLPLREAKEQECERSTTDVMPAYRPSEKHRNDIVPSEAICGQQTTQPLDGHALRAVIEAQRSTARKPSFTGRVVLPPVDSQMPVPIPAPPNSTPRAASFPLRASFQVPTIMPPPIPPAFPAGANANGAVRTTQQPTSVVLPIPDTTEPPWQRAAPKQSDSAGHPLLIPIVVIAGLGALGIAAFLISAPPERLATTPVPVRVAPATSALSASQVPSGSAKSTTVFSALPDSATTSIPSKNK